MPQFYAKANLMPECTSANKWEVVTVFSGLALMVAFLYLHAALHNFWLYDDPFILRFLDRHSFFAYALKPEVWKEFSSAHFTPLVVLSYAFDYHLFGLDHQWFYLHSIFSLWLLAVLVYAAARLYTSWWAALAGVIFLVVSRPFASAAEILMFRHYVEGGVLACAFFLLFVLALRKNSFSLAVPSSLFYFLSMTAKEVYIPLALLVLFLPEQTWRLRVRMAVPLIPAGIVYFAWRWWMLGSPIGGFSGMQAFSLDNSTWHQLFLIFQYLFNALAENSGYAMIPGALILFILLFSLLTASLKKNISLTLFAGACLFCLCLPLLPVAGYLTALHVMEMRFAFAAAVLISVLTAAAFSYSHQLFSFSPSLQKAWIFLLIVIIIGLGISNRAWLMEQRDANIIPMTREGLFLWNHDGSGVLVRSSSLLGTHYYANLDFFARREQGSGLPVVIGDGPGLLSSVGSSTDEPVRFYRYDSQLKAVKEKTGQISKRRQPWLEAHKPPDFNVSFQVRKGHFNLHLASREKGGRFFILIGYLPNVYCDAFLLGPGNDISFKGNFFAGLSGYFRFGWKSDDGIVSLSPEWWVDFGTESWIKWPECTLETHKSSLTDCFLGHATLNKASAWQ